MILLFNFVVFNLKPDPTLGWGGGRLTFCLALPCYPVCQPANILLSRAYRIRSMVRIRVRVSVKG